MASKKRILLYESIVNHITSDGKKVYVYDKLNGIERTFEMNKIYKQLYKDKLHAKV